MKRTFKILVIVFASLLVVTTAYAWTGVDGKAVDSKTGAGWAHGGTAYAVSSVDGMLGTYPLSTAAGTEGEFSGAYTATPGATITVYIVFSPGPNGTPATNSDCTFIDVAIPVHYGCGNILTGTGPTAITLADLTAESSAANPWLPAILVVGALAVVSGGLVVVRRKRS